MLTAHHQSSMPADKVLHSGNAGFIVARTAQVKAEFRAEGHTYATDIARYMNAVDLNGASFLFFEEVFGRHDLVHCLVHFKSPVDFALTVHLVDHDPRMNDLLEGDRFGSTDDRGNWGRIVEESSMRERILVPQHGGGHHEDNEHHEDDTWVEPAHRQCVQPIEDQLHTANAPLVVHRTAQARHEFRNEARNFGFAWQDRINEHLVGRLTCYLYEETFGQMDRLHWLIHFRSIEDWFALRRLAEHDAQVAQVFTRDFIPTDKGGGNWARTFVPGTTTDVLLAPIQMPAAG